MNDLELSLQILKVVFTEENLDNLSPSQRAEEVLKCFKLIYNTVVDLENQKSRGNASLPETIGVKKVFSSGELPLDDRLVSRSVTDLGINRSTLWQVSSGNKKTLEDFLSELNEKIEFELPESEIKDIKSWRLSILSESEVVDGEVFLVDLKNIREILSTLGDNNRRGSFFKIKNRDLVVSVRSCGRTQIPCLGRDREGACSQTKDRCDS